MDIVTRIVVETNQGYLLLEPTSENFAVATALANNPVYTTNGEWDENKITYARRDDINVKISVKSVRIVDAQTQLIEQRIKAEEARWKAEAEKNATEKKRAEIQKALDAAVAEIAALTQMYELKQREFEKQQAERATKADA